MESFLNLCKPPINESPEARLAREQLVMQTLQLNTIGYTSSFSSALGPRRIVYCDYFASAKSLSFIEQFIINQVLPFYANTHTDATETGKSTALLREQARLEIKKAINGMPVLGKNEALVSFSGTGSTAAINKLVHIFRLKDVIHWQSLPTSFIDKLKFVLGPREIRIGNRANHLVNPVSRPVVFMSIQEHHANILPWRVDTACDIVYISELDGKIDISELKDQLALYSKRPLLIGTFTAGSNLTGVLNDVDSIATLMHSYNGFALFDYAGVGAYCSIDMNPSISSAYKDAVVLSPHKMIGGPSTPGILAVRRATMMHLVKHDYSPSNTGGGIVTFVSKKVERYTADMEEMEEAGTPGIIESIRCGLVFAVKNAVGTDLISKMEHISLEFIKTRLQECPEIRVFGDMKERVPVISFVVGDKRLPGKVYHFDFVTSALNDLFGIQTRGGCMCAHIYSQTLSCVTDEAVELVESLLTVGMGPDCVKDKSVQIFKPGFTRLSFNYFMNQEDMTYVMDALLWLTKNAHKLIFFYDYDCITGKWNLVKKLPKTNLAFGSCREVVEGISKAECFIKADELCKETPVEQSVDDIKPLLLTELKQYRHFIIREDLI